VLYCVENEDIKGIVIYKFTKPDYVFSKEIEIARNIFDTNSIEYSEIETIDKRYGFGISFIIEKRK
jgi:hypothetical protein